MDRLTNERELCPVHTGPVAGHPVRHLASSGHDSAVLFPDVPAGGASCPQQSWSLGAVGRVPGLLGGPSSLTELSGGMTDVPAAAGSPG